MRLPQSWLQHLLIVLPAVATLYVDRVESVAEYIGLVLLALFALRVADMAPASVYALIPLQIVGLGWFGLAYGGLLAYAPLSGLVSAFLYFRRPAHIGGLALLSIAAANAVALLQGPADVWAANLTALALVLLLTAAGREHSGRLRLERSNEALSAALESAAQEKDRLEEFARKVENYAQTEERGRIAAEIHDDLGHRLIRLKMMSEAALQLESAAPDQAFRLLAQIRDQLGESMDNMRTTVRKLRPAGQEEGRKYALRRLIEDAGRDLRIAVSFELRGLPRPLYPSVEYSLFRNAQEAITNAVRHGRASAVAIELTFADDSVTMRVTNDGAVPERITPGVGFRAMRERTATLGGRLSVETEPAFTVTTCVPDSAARHSASGEVDA